MSMPNLPFKLDGTQKIDSNTFVEDVIAVMHPLVIDGYRNYSYAMALDSSDNLVDIDVVQTNLTLINCLNTAAHNRFVESHKGKGYAYVVVVSGHDHQLNVWRDSKIDIADYFANEHNGFKDAALLDVFYVDLDKLTQRSLMCDDDDCCPAEGHSIFKETVDAVTDVVVDEITDDQKTILDLNRRIENLKSELAEAQKNHRDDIDTIKRALDEEAEDRDWCNEYQDFLDNVNPNLTYELGDYVQEYTVTVEVTRTMHQRVEVEVRAKSYDAAQELAVEEVEADVDVYINDYNWNEEDTVELA